MSCFNKLWTERYSSADVGQGARWMAMCYKTVALFKEYELKQILNQAK